MYTAAKRFGGQGVLNFRDLLIKSKLYPRMKWLTPAIGNLPNHDEDRAEERKSLGEQALACFDLES